MTFANHQQQLAQGQIQIGIQRLADKYPFHAKTLERFDVCARPKVGTMGVMVAGDVIRLLYNPDFVLSISIAELTGVLLHEVHHVIFGHILTDPADYPDDWARTVAQEVTVNEFVREPLPGQPITLDQFSSLPPLESTKRRYERLKQRRRRQPLASLTLPDGAAAGEVGAERTVPGGTGQGPTLLVTDNHEVWQEGLADRDEAEATVRAVMQDVAQVVEVDQLPPQMQQMLKDRWLVIQKAFGAGNGAGGNRCEIRKGSRGRLAWVRLFRRYIGRCLEVSPDFARPARRYPELVGIVPGKRRRSGRPNIMAVIDTSGSLTPELLELINAELARLAIDYQVTVVECDAEIQRVYPYRAIREVQGRGGTDFCAPFDRAFLRKHRPDLIVYFTDGDGPVPENPPNLPVLWCLTPGGNPPCEWARVIRIDAAAE